MDFLRSIHERSFAQWGFELSQGFSVCLYGFGSQRQILSNFAQHVYDQQKERGIEKPKIVVVNGYTPNITTRDVLGAIGACLPDLPKKLGATPAEATERILSHLSSLPQTSDNKITLLINSLDSPGLRRAATQTLLARLASSPSIHLLCSVSHPNFPLLWDSALRTHYNFVFHDATTLAPYDMEIDVVESVHQLLGRSGRRVGGREGVGFVLRSLPVNARSLYRILCLEILVLMDEGGGDFGGFVEEDDEDEDGGVRGPGGGRPRSGEVGVEYRALYTKAVEDFVCGDEVAFRSLLKE
jgi:origin recognition complex subunit 2